MSSRYRVILVVSLLLVAMVVGACADPRPIKRLPAPTPIGRAVAPTPTLVPALAKAMEAGEEEGTAAVPAVAPAQPPDAVAGQKIFVQNCAVCHGKDGKGVVQGTPNYTDPNFVRNAVPAALFQTITKGKGSMPSWEGTLSEQQRWNVLFYELDFGIKDEDVAKGKQIFTKNCAVCHGKDGKGVVQGTPDFTSPAFWVKQSMADLFKVVSKGKGAMPAWEGTLSEADRWAALSYVRTFGYKSVHKP